MGRDIVIPGGRRGGSSGRLPSANPGHHERREQDPFTDRSRLLERLATEGQRAVRLASLERDLGKSPERRQDQIDRFALFAERERLAEFRGGVVERTRPKGHVAERPSSRVRRATTAVVGDRLTRLRVRVHPARRRPTTPWRPWRS